MSRDYHAKRLAKELDIPYAEALRRVRQARAVVEQTAAEMAEATESPTIPTTNPLWSPEATA